jgi:ketosteroid isomerase-like protein
VAVTSGNVELVRSIYADWERGDFRSAEWADPGIEFVIADGPTKGSWTGVARMARAWFDLLEAWDDFRVVADEYREAEGGLVWVLDRRGGRGKRSGIDATEMMSKGASLFLVKEGKVARLVIYAERTHALPDLSLTPGQD